MKKRIFTGLMASLAVLSAMAVPAKPGYRTVAMADGTTISVEKRGDEHFHFLATTDNLPVKRMSDGNYYYITKDGVSTMRAHDPAHRTSDENNFIAKQKDALSIEHFVAQSMQLRQEADRAASRVASVLKKADSQVPHEGDVRVPVVLVSYQDVDFLDGENANEVFQDFFNGDGVSARKYFMDQSHGKYRPQFDVFGPYKLSGKRVVYGRNDFYGDDQGAGKMVAEACIGLNSEINFKNYDNDGDGICDVIICLYAGVGEASIPSDDPEADEVVWPHQFQLSSSDYGHALNLDGVTIDKYACFNEENGTSRGKIDGIGTVCHEFSHCLGLPDYYDTNYSGLYYGMGEWSLMDHGSYNDDGYTPIGYGAYEREFMGWITIAEAVPNTHYTLPILGQGNEDFAVKISSSTNPNEYFILENRNRQGWDKYIAADGMLITHVTYSEIAWLKNTVNNSSPERMTFVPADNTRSDYSTAGDLWPGINNTATQFTDTSRPAATLNTGGSLAKPVTEITRNNDATISFWVMKGAKRPLLAPELGDMTDIKADGFTVNWSHADDCENVTFAVEVSKHREVEQLLSTVFGENLSATGWSLTSTTSYAAWDATYKLFKIGSSNRNGGIKSPKVRVDGNQITVVINAACYGSDNSVMVVETLDSKGNSIATKEVTLTPNSAESKKQNKCDLANYVVVLDAAEATDNYITISSKQAKNRIMIASAEIYLGDTSAMFDGSVSRAANTGDEVLHFTGITDMMLVVTGLENNQEYDVRVKALTSDDTRFNDSEWSKRKSVITSDNVGVEDVTVAVPANTAAEYYNLQGVRVTSDNLTPGIYVVRRGNVVEKIVIR